MTYHQLSNDTAQTPERRAEEAQQLIKQLADHTETMNQKEQGFISETSDRLDQYGTKAFISPKQLFYLRDLVSRYVHGI
jgi:hypothetical protein